MSAAPHNVQQQSAPPVNAPASLSVEQAVERFQAEQTGLEKEFASNNLAWFGSMVLARFKPAAVRHERLNRLRKEYLDMLYSRDVLETSVRTQKTISGEMMCQIGAADEHLRKLTFELLNVYRLDFEAWRHTRDPKPNEWWWFLDEERFGEHSWRFNLTRPTLYTAAGLFLVFLVLPEIVRVAGRVSNVLINVFARSNLANLGLDLLTVGAFFVQVVVGGRISLLFAHRIVIASSRWIRRFDARPRWLLSGFFPVTDFFVATLLFVGMLLLVSNFAVDSVGTALRATVDEPGKSISDRQTLLDLASALDPNADRPVELTRIGLNYEAIGNYPDAKTAYEQALSAEPSFIVTSYLLADLYSEQVLPAAEANDQTALRILNQAVSAIEDVGLSHTELHLSAEGYVPQFQYLLRLTRAKVFFNMGETVAAVNDLNDAERLTRRPANETLFIRWDNKPASGEVVAEGQIVPIPITELYYWRARSETLLYEQTEASPYRAAACTYWSYVIQLANNMVGKEAIWKTHATAARRELQCASL